MSLDELCLRVRRGDEAWVASQLRQVAPDVLNTCDEQGMTPLMHAVCCADTNIEIVRLLLQRGADPNGTSEAVLCLGKPILSLALGAGDPQKVAALLDAGADLHYSSCGYDALFDAVHGRDLARDKKLMALLQLLIERGANLNTTTAQGESALRVLSRVGRFDGVAVLLAAGADERQLGWTPLIRAVAIGTFADVQAQIGNASLETRDYWERTAWLIAVAAGDVRKAELLLQQGADRRARGRYAKPALFYAVDSHSTAMLAWLIDQGVDPIVTDQSGYTALARAAELGNHDAIGPLLGAGIPIDAGDNGMTALWHAVDATTARVLLAAGADPQHLQHEQRRGLLGLPSEPDVQLLQISAAEFESGRDRRYGSKNPELTTTPFWHAMVRAGVCGFLAAERFDTSNYGEGRPVWCAQRFGQSITFLPDGRIVQVAGEHEDSYDPDFCIYNDVFVHAPDGGLDIYSYPSDVFPPTDFHTATQVGDQLYLIGSLGYAGSRHYGATPVYTLHLHTFQIARIDTSGEMPGWISRHRAHHSTASAIRISGGKVAQQVDGREEYVDNASVYELDLVRAVWRRIG